MGELGNQQAEALMLRAATKAGFTQIDFIHEPLAAAYHFEQKIQQAAKNTLHKLRGGARQRAGRKSRPHVRTTVLLAPAIRKKLETLAIRDGSLSAAVEKLVQAVSVA